MHVTASQTLLLALGVGSLVLIVAHRVRLPAILFLLVAGAALGRSGLRVIDPGGLGPGLKGLIAVAIALLIFEGSLHLDRRTLAAAPRAVWRLITVGAIVTWVGAAVLGRVVLGLEWGLSVVLGAILIVTGPTVIQPVIKRVPLRPNLHAVLASEGILIDAIGAIAAISVMDVVAGLLADGGVLENISPGSMLSLAGMVALRLAAGASIGWVAGMAAVGLLRASGKRRDREARHPAYAIHLVAMGACMLSAGLSEMIAEEAGLAAATTAGLVFARTRLIGAAELRRFKEQIAEFFLAVLFVLLAARFDLRVFVSADALPMLVFAGGLLLVVRPLNVMVSTLGSTLTWRERLFAALFAPRGIVAASVASIAAIHLAGVAGAIGGPIGEAWAADAARMEQAVVVVIVVTVGLATLLTGPLASLLRVRAASPSGVVIVGANRLGRDLALALVKEDVSVTLVDTSPAQLAAAASWGIPTELGDATNAAWMDSDGAPASTGWVVAVTGNADVDAVVARWAVARCGPGRAFVVGEDAAETARAEGVSHALTSERPTMALVWDLERGALKAGSWTVPRPNSYPFAMLEPGGGGTGISVRLLPDGEAPADMAPGAKLVGLYAPEAE